MPRLVMAEGHDKKQYKRRLPPIWWIRRKIEVRREGGPAGWYHAEYTWRNNSWGVTSETKEDAVESLVDSMRRVKDGSLLAEYYRKRDLGIY